MPELPPRKERRPPGQSNRQALIAPSSTGSGQPRTVASYKIADGVKRRFARFVKWYNRDRDPSEETEIGVLAEQALEAFMKQQGYSE